MLAGMCVILLTLQPIGCCTLVLINNVFAFVLIVQQVIYHATNTKLIAIPGNLEN